jgi:hypothetical protein
MSVSRPSVKAARRPIETILPSARIGPVYRVIALW